MSICSTVEGAFNPPPEYTIYVESEDSPPSMLCIHELTNLIVISQCTNAAGCKGKKMATQSWYLKMTNFAGINVWYFCRLAQKRKILYPLSLTSMLCNSRALCNQNPTYSKTKLCRIGNVHMIWTYTCTCTSTCMHRYERHWWLDFFILNKAFNEVLLLPIVTFAI